MTARKKCFEKLIFNFQYLLISFETNVFCLVLFRKMSAHIFLFMTCLYAVVFLDPENYITKTLKAIKFEVNSLVETERAKKLYPFSQKKLLIIYDSIITFFFEKNFFYRIVFFKSGKTISSEQTVALFFLQFIVCLLFKLKTRLIYCFILKTSVDIVDKLNCLETFKDQPGMVSLIKGLQSEFDSLKSK